MIFLLQFRNLLTGASQGGTPPPPPQNGWDGSVYWINYVQTTLDEYGNGSWNCHDYASGVDQGPTAHVSDGWDTCYNHYYINGDETTLDENGDGEWNGSSYINGQIQAPPPPQDGWDGTNYLIGGQVTTLDENGNGLWNGTYYQDGSVGSHISNGFDSNWQTYFIGNVATTLTSDGDGTWNGHYYEGGNLFTGEHECHDYVSGVDQGPRAHISDGWDVCYNTYYINNEATTLDENGDGTWNGSTYTGGVSLNGVVDGVNYNNGVPGAGVVDGLQYDDTGALADGLYNGHYYSAGEDISVENGWDSNRGYYYVSGNQTELNESGTGTYNNYYWENGASVNWGVLLDSGFRLATLADGLIYYINPNGVLIGLADGPIGNYYYYQGTPFTGFANEFYYADGNKAMGLYEGVFYQNGVPGSGNDGTYQYGNDGYPANGVFGGINYSNGLPAAGTVSGIYYGDDGHPFTGVYESYHYSNGVQGLHIDGWDGSVYWVNGNQTNLDQSGFGEYQGYMYVGGQQTTLNQYGTGLWNPNGNGWIYYVDGTEVQGTIPDGGYNIYGNGFMAAITQVVWVVDGDGSIASTLDQYGTGEFNSLYYQNGVRLSGISVNDGKLYEEGVLYTGSSSITGPELYYYNGQPLTGQRNDNYLWYFEGGIANGTYDFSAYGGPSGDHTYENGSCTDCG